MADEHEFNYGKLFNFYSQDTNRWIKGSEGFGGRSFKVGVGNCYCLSVALWQLYPAEEAGNVREKLISKIKELYPTRISKFATKLAQAKEPLITEQYSVVAFNDHPETDVDDILYLTKECRV